MKLLILSLLVLLGSSPFTSAGAAEYAVAYTPAPVLNSPDFKAVFGGTDGQHLKFDRCGQLRELEYIALPGSVFTILRKQRSGTTEIYQVETDEYAAPPNVRLYVDGRFLKLATAAPSPRKRSLPQQEEIVATLRGAVGSPYVWGGNIPEGVPEPAAWFGHGLRGGKASEHILAGLDCSGLLYYATGGWTPRNTSQLIKYGQVVATEGKRSAEIAAQLQPLDLVVWNGHVIIVLDRQTAIESRLECGKSVNGGVVTTPLPQRIAEIMSSRHPTNAWTGALKRRDIFIVRRWYPPYNGAISGNLLLPQQKKIDM